MTEMSNNSKLHNGKLTPKQLFEGIQVTLNNSKSLYEDAVLLFEAERYPRAASLAILSIEEVGKAYILGMMAISDDNEELTKLWKNFTRHTSKNFLGVIINRLLAGDRTIDNLLTTIKNGADALNYIKQQGFYVDH